MQVFVRERAALALSKLSSAQDFLTALQEEDLTMPLLASLRLVCRSAKDDGAPIYMVVEGSAQNLIQPPSNASDWLFPLIGACPEAAGRVLPSRVKDLSCSALYPLMVQKQVVTKALVLLVSTEKSKLEECGEGSSGYFVRTKNVMDVMDLSTPKLRFHTKALCTLGNSLQFKLDPVGGSEQCVLALVQGLQKCGASGEELVLLLSGVTHVHDKQAVEEAFKTYMTFTDKIQSTTRSKRPLQWTPETAKTCRRLSRSPTDT